LPLLVQQPSFNWLSRGSTQSSLTAELQGTPHLKATDYWTRQTTPILSVIVYGGDRNVHWYTSECWSETRNRRSWSRNPQATTLQILPFAAIRLMVKKQPQEKSRRWPEMQ
jgi:homospermidine synthase